MLGRRVDPSLRSRTSVGGKERPCTSTLTAGMSSQQHRARAPLDSQPRHRGCRLCRRYRGAVVAGVLTLVGNVVAPRNVAAPRSDHAHEMGRPSLPGPRRSAATHPPRRLRRRRSRWLPVRTMWRASRPGRTRAPTWARTQPNNTSAIVLALPTLSRRPPDARGERRDP